MNEITMAQKIIANEIDMAFSFTPGNMRAVQQQNKKVITHSDQPPHGFMDWWPIGLGLNTTEMPFDASVRMRADYSARIWTGEARAFLWGHGGSMREPFSTWDRVYHTRHFRPTGTATGANLYRWQNKEFSDIVDQMGLVAEDDPKLMDLWIKSLEIWLPELPDVQLVHTVIPLPMNTTYWTNYPSSKDPYVHEGFWHRNALQMFLKLEPAQ